MWMHFDLISIHCDSFLLIYKEDRHAALTLQNAVDAT